MLSLAFRVMQEINVEISNDIYKYQHPKPMHWSGIRWLIHLWIGQAKSWSTAGGVKWHSWNRTVGQCRHFPCHEISWCCRRLLHSQLLFHWVSSLFETHCSCFADLLNHPVTHICACAIRSFSFLLSQGRQEVIRAALVTEMHSAASMQLETLR